MLAPGTMAQRGDEIETAVPGPPPEIAKNLSNFITKLIQMIGEPTTDFLISWTQEGKTFTVHHASVLAEKVLPKYFKHKNFTSLVRQLNMYGFHKVIEQSKTLADKTSDQVWEFIHPCVHRDKPELLMHVKRKESAAQLKKDALKGHVEGVMVDLHELRSQQHLISSRFMEMQRLNVTLHQQVLALQSRHSRQQAQIGKIMEFLERIVHDDGPNALGSGSATILSPPAPKRSRVEVPRSPSSEASSAARFASTPHHEHHVAALDQHVQEFDATLSSTRERLTAAGINPGVVHGIFHHDGDAHELYDYPTGAPGTSGVSTSAPSPADGRAQAAAKQGGLDQASPLGTQAQQELYYPLHAILGDHAHHDEAAPPSEFDPLLSTSCADEGGGSPREAESSAPEKKKEDKAA